MSDNFAHFYKVRIVFLIMKFNKTLSGLVLIASIGFNSQNINAQDIQKVKVPKTLCDLSEFLVENYNLKQNTNNLFTYFEEFKRIGMIPHYHTMTINEIDFDGNSVLFEQDYLYSVLSFLDSKKNLILGYLNENLENGNLETSYLLFKNKETHELIVYEINEGSFDKEHLHKIINEELDKNCQFF